MMSRVLHVRWRSEGWMGAPGERHAVVHTGFQPWLLESVPCPTRTYQWRVSALKPWYVSRRAWGRGRKPWWMPRYFYSLDYFWSGHAGTRQQAILDAGSCLHAVTRRRVCTHAQESGA